VNPANASEIIKQWLDVHALPRAPMAEGMVDGHPREVWWNADGETVVESYAITDMAHGTPLGLAEDDKRYGREGTFILEAGISSSYHIAKFFGLTGWIRDAKPALAESPSAKLIPAVSFMTPVAAPQPVDAAPPGRPVREARATKHQPTAKKRSVIGDVGAAISRALIAAGLMK
jgi:hypothetical protein